MSMLIAIREASLTGNGVDYSPAKEKASNGDVYGGSLPLLHRRLRLFVNGAKYKLLLLFCVIASVVLLGLKISYVMGWNPDYPSFVSSTHRVGYTVLINTWKRNSLLKQPVAHYASCQGTNAIHVVWSEADSPSRKMRDYLKHVVCKKSQAAHKPNFRFDLNEEDNLNNIFKPIADLRTDVIFSTARTTMVGFIPRMHWLNKEKNGEAHYGYGGWWSVWWTGTYSMVLSKAAFFIRSTWTCTHKNDYITKERNCEDIAISLLIANASGSPPIWVKGMFFTNRLHDLGSEEAPPNPTIIGS